MLVCDEWMIELEREREERVNGGVGCGMLEA